MSKTNHVPTLRLTAHSTKHSVRAHSRVKQGKKDQTAAASVFPLFAAACEVGLACISHRETCAFHRSIWLLLDLTVSKVFVLIPLFLQVEPGNH